LILTRLSPHKLDHYLTWSVSDHVPTNLMSRRSTPRDLLICSLTFQLDIADPSRTSAQA